jgi:hypothetical protein
MHVRQFARASPQDKVSEAHTSLLDHAAAIPANIGPLCKPASAKPVLDPPAKWQVNDAVKKDRCNFFLICTPRSANQLGRIAGSSAEHA